ncbi:branched-chain amino acid ABC transporter permease [Deltaproteobacteria bacterium]|nr:branched-chain amino acid ABC transporter permease [Deltaproteobacteria bacterium]
MTLFFQQLINGLSLGAIYALIALGYTMVYGTLQLINFAHSEVFMMGAFAALLFSGAMGYEDGAGVIPAILVALVAMGSCAVLGMTIERLAYRPMRNSSRLNMLITAIGVSIFLQNLALKLWGTNLAFPDLIPKTNWNVLGVNVASNSVLVLGVTLVLMVLLTWVVERTKIGLSMRAVSHSRETAALMGIPVDRTISFTFALGSALAGPGPFLFLLRAPQVDPQMGAGPGLKAFVAAVLGGIGSVPGAVAGALVLGLSETFVSGYLSSTWRDAVAFCVLILILLYKPSGLFGKNTVEKV